MIKDHYPDTRLIERRCNRQWSDIVNDPNANKPPVLFFENQPVGFEESGLYVGFIDFKNLQKSHSQDVPMTSLYHSLIFHFSRTDRELYDQANAHLYNNPYNSSSWNTESFTYKYFINTEILVPYAVEKVTKETKIPGVGKFGRQILKLVIYDIDYEPLEPSTNS